MKTLSFIALLCILVFPGLLKGQAACESGSSQETCSANIPLDAIPIKGHQMISNVATSCYWVCAGDTLILHNASDCSVYLEPLARLEIGGTGNYVWAKSESKVEILAGSFGTTLGILEDVIFIDEGTNTDETICNGITFNYDIAPDDGCDLTGVVTIIEPGSIQVFPNPVNGTASILISLEDQVYGEIYLLNSNGKRIKKWSLNGQPTMELALGSISSGVYFLRIPNSNLVEKIVVF